MSTNAKQGAREKILVAAADIARDVGPANLSLDAVAARAGVSKGGLLYHFPAKVHLLEALIEEHTRTFQNALDRNCAALGSGPCALLKSYLEVFVAEQEQHLPPPSGVLAAMVQNPELLVPIQRFKRDMLDRLKADSPDPATALTVFLALEGLRSLELFGVGVLTQEESRGAVAALEALVAGTRR